MTTHVLPFDPAVVPQETGWWCGPASAQVTLNSLGVIRTEQQLANEIGTTFNGTNQVGMITTVLNRWAPRGGYVARYTRGGTMTSAEAELLWSDLVASIGAGRPVVCNIDAPPSNYPRGVKGSDSPPYGGGEVLHYFTAVGIDDAWVLGRPGQPNGAVFIADSYNRQTRPYWISFAQLVSLIPPKGWTAAPGLGGLLTSMSQADADMLVRAFKQADGGA